MSPNNDPLAAYYEEEDPLAAYYEDPEEKPVEAVYQAKKDIFGDIYDPNYENPNVDITDEFERIYERGDQQAAAGLVSGASLGITENIPGLETGDNVAAIGGKVIGSTLPIGKMISLFGKPFVTLAQKSPILARQLEGLANLTGVGLAGGTYGAVTGLTEDGKMPTIDDFLEHGLEWGLLDLALQSAGAGGRFVSSLLKKSKSVNKPSWKVVNETIQQMKKDGVDFSKPEEINAKALSILEKPVEAKPTTREAKVTEPQKDYIQEIENRIEELKNTKVSPKDFSPLTGKAEELAIPYVPNNFTVTEVLEEAQANNIAERMEQIAPRKETKREFGQDVQKEINQQFEKAKKEYEPLYELAEKESELIYTQTRNAPKAIDKILKEIVSLKTKPEGYKKVISNLESAVEDVGWQIQRDEAGNIERIIGADEVPLKNLIGLKRRLNKIVSFDLIETGIENSLKPVIGSLDKDIKAALKAKSKTGLQALEKADKKFAETAQKFGRKAIKKARVSESPEELARLVRNPSALADVKSIVSKEEFAKIERELLEHMNELSMQRARDFYREIRPSLNEDAQILANEIINSKQASPTRIKSLRDNLEESVINELAKASITGERPTTSLKLWKTTNGQQLIKNALKDNPNGKEMISYLENQSFYDFTSSFIESDGQVNFKKLKDLMKDPGTIENIRKIGGEDAVKAFRNLETLSNNLEKNIQSLDELNANKQKISKEILGKEAAKIRKEAEPSKAYQGKKRLKEMAAKSAPIEVSFNKFINEMDPATKIFLTALGVYNIVPLSVGYAAYKIFTPLLKSQKFRKAFEKAASSRNNPSALIGALEQMDEASSQ